MVQEASDAVELGQACTFSQRTPSAIDVRNHVVQEGIEMHWSCLRRSFMCPVAYLRDLGGVRMR